MDRIATLAAAYGRGLNALASRYLDIFLVGIVLNAACLFHLIAALPGRPTRCLAGLWLIGVLTSASQKPLQFAEQRLAMRRDTAAIQTENLKRFLATGDRSALEGKPIPYPSPGRLCGGGRYSDPLPLARPAYRDHVGSRHPGDPPAAFARPNWTVAYTGQV